MLYNLLLPHIHNSHIANLFHYITFRSGLAIIITLSLSFITGPILIKFLRSLQKTVSLYAQTDLNRIKQKQVLGQWEAL